MIVIILNKAYNSIKLKNILLFEYSEQKDLIKCNAYINPFPHKMDRITTAINQYTHIYINIRHIAMSQGGQFSLKNKFIDTIPK